MKTIFNSPMKITQIFGGDHNLTINGKIMRASQYYGQWGLAGHEGLDVIPEDLGDWSVISPEGNGQVVTDVDDPKSGGAYGNTITIWYPNKKIALQFCHLAQNYVNVGDKISKGQKIGKMGSTGNTAGAHVHINRFEVDDNGYRQNRENGYLGGTDPLIYFNEKTDAEAVVTLPVKEVDEMRMLRDTRYNFIKAVCDFIGVGYKDNLDQLLEDFKKKYNDIIEGYKGRETKALKEKEEVETQLEVTKVSKKQSETELAEKKAEWQNTEEGYLARIKELSSTNPDTEKLQKEHESQLAVEREAKEKANKKANELEKTVVELQSKIKQLEKREVSSVDLGTLISLVFKKIFSK